tara:strand:+ start:35552 stop:35872 length:321 start_codon:yes stop_codon:yes gene_type:complete
MSFSLLSLRKAAGCRKRGNDVKPVPGPALADIAVFVFWCRNDFAHVSKTCCAASNSTMVGDAFLPTQHTFIGVRNTCLCAVNEALAGRGWSVSAVFSGHCLKFKLL